MSKFIQIQPFGTRIVGRFFQISPNYVNRTSTLLAEFGDSKFTDDVKAEDTILVYDFTGNFKEYKVLTVVSDTELTIEGSNDKVIHVDYITKKFPVAKKVLVDRIVGYKEDTTRSNSVYLEVDSGLIKDDKISDSKLTSPYSNLQFGGTSGNKRSIEIFGEYSNTKPRKYKVQIDTAPVAHAITITCPADSSGSLENTGFLIRNKYLIYYRMLKADARNESIIEAIEQSNSEYAPIEVNYNENDSASTIATNTYNAIDAVDGALTTEFTVSNLSSATFRITNSVTARPNESLVPFFRTFGTSMLDKKTISFFDAGSYGVIEDSAGGFDVAGDDSFRDGDMIHIKGALNEENNGYKQILKVVSSSKILIRYLENYDGLVRELAVDRDPGLAKGSTSELNYGIDIIAGDSGVSAAVQTQGTNCKFKWTNEADLVTDEWNATTVEILGEHLLENGIGVRLPNKTTYTVNDYWTFEFSSPCYIKHNGTIEEIDEIFNTQKTTLTNVSEGTGISY